MKSKLVTLKLPQRLSAKVASLAKRRQTSRSEIIRAAIEAYRGQGEGSFAEKASYACGVAKSGHEDLSFNPRHLRGYGK